MEENKILMFEVGGFMATSQINQLRSQFNSLNEKQQSNFIKTLELKLQGRETTEYAKFLNECKAKYNSEIQKKVQSGEVGQENTILCLVCDKHTQVTGAECEFCGIPISKVKELDRKMDKAKKVDLTKIVIGYVICGISLLLFFVPIITIPSDSSTSILPYIIWSTILMVFSVALLNISFPNGKVDTSKEKVKKQALQEKQNYEIAKKMSAVFDK